MIGPAAGPSPRSRPRPSGDVRKPGLTPPTLLFRRWRTGVYPRYLSGAGPSRRGGSGAAAFGLPGLPVGPASRRSHPQGDPTTPQKIRIHPGGASRAIAGDVRIGYREFLRTPRTPQRKSRRVSSMTDDLVARWADLLVDYCLRVEPGETILIGSELEARPLVEACYRAVVLRGAHPLVRLDFPGLAEFFLEHATDEQLAHLPPSRRPRGRGRRRPDPDLGRDRHPVDEPGRPASAGDRRPGRAPAPRGRAGRSAGSSPSTRPPPTPPTPG